MRRALFLFLCSPLLAACGGGGGDPLSKPLRDELGSGSRIREVVGPATWVDPADMMSEACKKQPVDKAANVSGVTILAIDRYDETGTGQQGNFYIGDTFLGAEQAGPYSGAEVFAPSFSPPDLRMVEGDVGDLLGVLQEFPGPSAGKFPFCRTLPEFGGTMSFRFEDAPIVPHTIPIADMTTYETARQWLGMLVRIENVSILDAPFNSKGRYSAHLDVGGDILATDLPGVSNELYDLEGEGPPIAQGTKFKSVTGIVTYFYGFHVAPRSPADFEP